MTGGRRIGWIGTLLAVSLAASPTAPAAGVPTPGAVVLKLKSVSSAAVPVPRIPGETVLRVPLYPGVTPATTPFGPQDEVVTPGSPYLRAAGRAFRLPRGTPASRVLAWYVPRMKGRGWIRRMTGSAYAPTGLTMVMEGFAP